MKGGLDFLFLNAGIQPASSWADPGQFKTIMDVNFFGVVHGITHLLDLVKTNPGSAIVISGSKQGITNPPGNPAYNASKSAVKTIAEQLSYDLRETDTSVHLLVPGWTFTGLGRTQDAINAAKPAGAWSASQVVDYLEAGIARREFYILCPDNEVTEDMDKKRIQWAAEDLVERRPPLSRWRDEFKEEFQKWSRD
jgi:NAD(P)-dependent dehydrogenase (short-subunit alcohol dehydrogenase family)